MFLLQKRRIQFEKELIEDRKRREEEEIKRQNNEKERRRKEKEYQKEIEKRREMEIQRLKREEENRRQCQFQCQCKCICFCQQKHITENEIVELANRAINGEFGNGKKRKARLGHLYSRVQNKVNELLGVSTRHKE